MCKIVGLGRDTIMRKTNTCCVQEKEVLVMCYVLKQNKIYIIQMVYRHSTTFSHTKPSNNQVQHLESGSCHKTITQNYNFSKIDSILFNKILKKTF